MSVCCVSGCGNQKGHLGKLKFFTIPFGYRTFQANRRILWLQAIQKVNGSVEELARDARVCGAHFISGQASMDINSPDFVPSVFTHNKQSPGYKKKGKWICDRSKKRRRKASEEAEEQTTPLRADSPDDLHMPQHEKETKTKDDKTEDKTENKTLTSETTSSPDKASPSLRLPAGLQDLNKVTPTLLLKSVFKPAVGFQCELCDQSFTTPSQLVKHKQLHEEPGSLICELCGKLFTNHTDFTEHQCSHEYSFACKMCDQSFNTRQNLKRHKLLHEEQKSFICELCGKLFTKRTDFTEHQRSHEYSFACNMCDRSFSTSQNLKRHKLLHVKDGRKCQKCGVLFCQRHNHVLYVPQTESEQDSYIAEESCKVSDGDRMAENTRWVKPDQTADLDDGAQSTMTVTRLPTTTVQTPSSAPKTPKPLPRTQNARPPASHTRILTEIPVPVFKKPFSVPRPAPPVPRCSRTNYPANFVQPHLPQLPVLPSSLKMFSPQFLTSAFLEVKRNYEYILSKPRAVKIENIVKEEPCELPLIPLSEEAVVRDIKGERAAYDLEIML